MSRPARVKCPKDGELSSGRKGAFPCGASAASRFAYSETIYSAGMFSKGVL